MDKIKELWDAFVAKVGLDWAIAVAVAVVLAFINPVLSIIVGVLFVLYRTGKLEKIVNKLKAKFAPKE